MFHFKHILDSLHFARRRWGLVVFSVLSTAATLFPLIAFALLAQELVLGPYGTLVTAGVALLTLPLVALSDAVLIRGIRAEKAGRFEWRALLRGFAREVPRVLGLTLIAAVASSVLSLGYAGMHELMDSGHVAVAAALIAVGIIPVALGYLTFWSWWRCAMRLLIVERRGVRSAARASWRMLHGRLLDCVKLVLAGYALNFAGGMVQGVLMVPAMLIGVAALMHFVPWTVAGLLMAPLLLLALVPSGLSKLVDSSIWTLGVLDARASD